MGAGGAEEEEDRGGGDRMSSPRRETEGGRERRGRECAFRLGIHLPFSGPVVFQEAYERRREGRDEASHME